MGPVIAYLNEPKDGHQHGIFSIVGIMNDGDFQHIGVDDSKKLFPPNGEACAKYLFSNHTDFEPCNFYIITLYPNKSADAGRGNISKFLVNERDDVKKVGTPVKDAKSINLTKDDFVDLETVRQKVNLQILVDDLKLDIDSDTYIWTKKGIVKCFFKSEGLDTLQYWHFSNGKFWEQNRNKLFFIPHNEGKQDGIVYGEIEGPSFTIDNVNDIELVKWFRKELKEKDASIFTYFESVKHWKEIILDILRNAPDNNIYKARINFILNHIQRFILSYEEIVNLKDNSLFADLIEKSIQNQLSLIKNSYKKEIELVELERDEKIYRINEEKEKKANEIQHEILEAELVKVEKIRLINDLKENRIKEIAQEIEEYEQIGILKNDEIKSIEQSISILNKKKGDILADFSIIKEVLSTEMPHNIKGKSYVVESYHDDKAIESTNLKILNKRIDAYLKEGGLIADEKSILGLTNSFCFCTLTIIPDIRFASAIIKSVNNTRYVVQQVGLDWISFEKLWNNGLGEIWKSAELFPDIMHVLILENLNMSHIDCFMTPVVDVLIGVRSVIPIGLTKIPSNLRLLCTVTEVGIGLPIFKKTILEYATPEVKYEVVTKIVTESENYYFKAGSLIIGKDYYNHMDFNSNHDNYVSR